MGLVFYVTTTTATPQLDPATLAAIRNSLAAAQQGRIGDACAIADKALEEGGDVVALNAMLGMLRGQAGDHDGAIRNLEIANDARPGDIRIATNLATALASAGRMVPDGHTSSTRSINRSPWAYISVMGLAPLPTSLCKMQLHLERPTTPVFRSAPSP